MCGSSADLTWLLEGSGGADAPGDDEFCDPLKWKQGSDKISPAFCYSVKCQKLTTSHLAAKII